MRIGITGIDGFLGWHLRAYFYGSRSAEIRGADRATFADREALARFVAGLDAVIHLAGMNRGNDVELEATNVELTDRLIAACDVARCRPHVVFASSTHAARDTAYGRSKRAAAERLEHWASQRQATVTSLVLPHVFGEFARPFYNSVVATFCYQLANKQAPVVENDAELELIHAQDVAPRIEQAIRSRENGDLRVHGQRIRVSELRDRLEGFSSLYGAQIVPDVRSPLDLRLFNTYRSYLFPHHYPVTLPARGDDRGVLFEAVKSLNPGQVFYSTTKPGATRGNHYHTRKVERFLVISGEAVIRVRKLFTREVVEFRVSGATPQYVDLPTFHTHSITNIGSEPLVTVFWAHEIYDAAQPDTYAESVIAE